MSPVCFEAPAGVSTRSLMSWELLGPSSVTMTPRGHRTCVNQSVSVSSRCPRRSPAIPTSTGNPTGAVCPRETIIEIAQLCKKHNAWLVVDEAYEHFLHDGERCTIVVDRRTDVVLGDCYPLRSRSHNVCHHNVAFGYTLDLLCLLPCPRASLLTW